MSIVVVTKNKEDASLVSSCKIKNEELLDFKLIKSETKRIEDQAEMQEILSQLINLGRAYRKLHFCKMDSGKYYNIALDEKNSGICDEDGNLDSLFLNTIQNWEQKIKNIYSELFRLTVGNRNVKFYQIDKKALYVEDILETYEEIASIPYMGEFCGKVYSKANKLFACDYNESEFIKAKEEFQPIWIKALNELDKALLSVDVYTTFSKNVVCEIVYAENEITNERVAV